MGIDEPENKGKLKDSLFFHGMEAERLSHSSQWSFSSLNKGITYLLKRKKEHPQKQQQTAPQKQDM